jgi:demethylmenaquinone methyltransferase/2-methoxy-6-polyprenyl-1,4-benzoquinol methylase
MEQKESRKIRRMFGAIAPSYDRANHLLSLSIDRYWRRLTCRSLAPLLPADPMILDLCAGTGDLTLQLARLGTVVGCDFSHPMLVLGLEKSRRARHSGEHIRFVEGDALRLPFLSGSFDAVTIAFGLRNLEDYDQGLREILRVLRRGGTLAVLEFSLPRIPVFREVYLFYFLHLLPRLGGWISGDGQAYSYLSRSVREFLEPKELERLLQEVGFSGIRHRLISGGVAALHLAQKNRLS